MKKTFFNKQNISNKKSCIESVINLTDSTLVSNKHDELILEEHFFKSYTYNSENIKNGSIVEIKRGKSSIKFRNLVVQTKQKGIEPVIAIPEQANSKGEWVFRLGFMGTVPGRIDSVKRDMGNPLHPGRDGIYTNVGVILKTINNSILEFFKNNPKIKDKNVNLKFKVGGHSLGGSDTETFGAFIIALYTAGNYFKFVDKFDDAQYVDSIFFELKKLLESKNDDFFISVKKYLFNNKNLIQLKDIINNFDLSDFSFWHYNSPGISKELGKYASKFYAWNFLFEKKLRRLNNKKIVNLDYGVTLFPNTTFGDFIQSFGQVSLATSLMKSKVPVRVINYNYTDKTKKLGYGPLHSIDAYKNAIDEDGFEIFVYDSKNKEDLININKNLNNKNSSYVKAPGVYLINVVHFLVVKPVCVFRQGLYESIIPNATNKNNIKKLYKESDNFVYSLDLVQVVPVYSNYFSREKESLNNSSALFLPDYKNKSMLNRFDSNKKNEPKVKIFDSFNKKVIIENYFKLKT